MKTAGNIPIPNQRIENGIHATGGIGLNTLIIKVAMSSRVLYHPRRIPKGMATTAAKSNRQIPYIKYQECLLEAFHLILTPKQTDRL